MKSTRTECCTELECESGLRNNYFEGKRLTADSFRIEQSYGLERRRLLNRAVFGWGVVYGFAIGSGRGQSYEEGAPGRLEIGTGLALDPCGRELVQTRAAKVSIDDLIVVDAKGVRADSERVFSSSASSSEDGRECWLLSAHYAEQKTGTVTVKDACNCEHKEWDHTCETIRYSLRPLDCKKCCDDFACTWSCNCASGRCCDEKKDDRPDHPPRRGGCRCLCEHLMGLEIADCCEEPVEIEEACGVRVRVDLKHGVPLACIEISEDDCKRRTFGIVDPCGPRRLVKRNDLLFDLIRGCDLTKIEEIGWRTWHRSETAINFDAFADGLTDEPRFWVKFSRPVRENTLRVDCFSMAVLIAEQEGGWREVLRVPIAGLDFESEDGDPAHSVRKATLVFNKRWVADAVRGGYTRFHKKTRVEIEVRGDFILDCNGQAVDANAFGLGLGGNGTPGGTFLSTFPVGRAPDGGYGAESSEGASS